jgi:hypothetical protein
MLKGAALALAQSVKVVSVLARNPGKLSALERTARARGGSIHPVPVDYRQTRAVLTALMEAQQRFGPIGLVVAWIHRIAPEAPLAVAEAVRNPERPCPYFHLLSSSTEDPSRPGKEWRAMMTERPGIEYHEVILGFVRGPDGSRWLSHQEICEGTLRAIEQGAPRTIIGTITPWSARP